LIQRQDKRGIDILMECLAVKEPWPIDNPTPAAQESNLASFRQSRHNVFARLASLLHEDFGYETRGNWTQQLDEAVPQMLDRLSALGYRCVTIPDLLHAWDKWLTSTGKRSTPNAQL
jgi:peptidoglycan/xylan/chitin deacetylase (PgdA/CDA1 family)